MRSTPKDARSPRIVAGVLPVAGGSGPKWSGVHGGTGVFTIRFVPPFAAPPVVTATVGQNAGAFPVVVSPTDATQTTIVVYGASGAQADAQVEFCATGPAR